MCDRYCSGRGRSEPAGTAAAKFLDSVRKDPDKPAIVWRNESISYGELDRRSREIASELIRCGVEPGSAVAVLLERSPDMVAAWLGIWRAGAAYVPLDPAYPAARSAFVIEDTGAVLVLTNPDLASAVPCGVTSVCVNEIQQSGSAGIPLPAAGPDALACILYTSGSTGTPNGVEVPHRGIIRLLFDCIYAQFGENDTFPLISAISFDASTFEVWGALLHGGTLAIPDDPVITPQAIASLFVRHRVTATFLTVSIFNQLVEENPDCLRGVRTLMAGGEALSVRHVRLALDRLPETTVINGYGPTEATTFACYYVVPRDFPAESPSVPIGWPIGNTYLRILEPGSLDVAAGAGELCIGGPGVALGYRNRPELKARKFIADPFEPGERLYRTGDLVRPLPGGALEFLGRIDHQVKIRGHRIELGELETVLQMHPEVRGAAVLLRERAGEKELVAWIAAESEPDVQAIRGWLRGRLPAYMLPAAIGTVGRLPLTAHGKVDRAALAAMPVEESLRKTVPPRNDREAALLDVLGQVLGRSDFGVTDHLLDIGGNSLTAMRFIARVRNRFALAIPIGAFLGSPSIESAARLAEPVEETRIAACTLDRLPAHPIQERFWAANLLYPRECTYSVPLRISIDGELDVGAFQAALEMVLRRHEPFWIRFHAAESGLEQIIDPPGAVPLAVESVSGEEAEARIQAESRTPFDLERGPIFRVRLFSTGPGRFLFLLNVHHVAIDGWSVGVILGEMESVYSAILGGERPLLPPLESRWRDYSAWVSENLASGAYAPAIDYWRRTLDGSDPALAVPGAESAAGSQVGGKLPFSIDRELREGVREYARKLGISPMPVYLAVWASLLRRYSGQDEICVNLPVAGRERAEVERLSGGFINAITVRVAIPPGITFAQLVEQVNGSLRGALDHQSVPPNLAVPRPLANAMMNYRDASAAETAFAGLPVRIDEVDNGSAKALLLLSVVAFPDGEVRAYLEHVRELAPMASRMADHFRQLLASALADPGGQVSRLAMLSSAERSELVSRRGPELEPPHATVPEWIIDNARLFPGRTAIRMRSGSLTYAQVIGRAERTAEWLRLRGVGRGARVAAKLSRSLDLIPSLIGTWLAGATYVPIDLSLPEARIQFILEDCRPAFILEDRHIEEIGLTEPAPYQPAVRGDAAYVIYTSGSTGRPKGVEVQHSALVNVIASFLRDPGFTSNDRMLAITPASFDTSALEFFLPLCGGGSSFLLTSAEVKDGPDAVKILDREMPTVMQSTPSHFAMLIWCGWRGHSQLRVWTGGEAVPRPLANDLMNRAAAVWNVYGPTETTIWSTAGRIEPAAGTVPIGRAIANTSVYVLDAAGELVPDGIPGELYIGGDGVALGYLDSPELTASRFLPSPFVAGERIYRTGDLVQWNREGQLEYLRRVDRQVKLNGLRIELGEVEAVLLSYPGVRQAAAIIREERKGFPYLAAYVAGDSVEAGGLRQHCESQLPSGSVPARFVTLSQLPLNPHGKLDYKALPAPPEPAQPEAQAALHRDLLEAELGEIWATALGMDRITARDDFFVLGGNSLSAARLLTAVERRFGARIPMVNLLSAPTIEQFARLIRGSAEVRSWSSVVPLQPEGERPPLFYACRLHALAGRHLADCLGTDQPVYGLEPPGMEGEAVPFTRVEELAAHYIESMRRVQARGPYHLVGHSFGGFIVYEMARQLLALGERVANLVLLDSSVYMLAAFRNGRPKLRRTLRRLSFGVKRTVYSATAIWDSERRRFARDFMANATSHLERAIQAAREEEAPYGANVQRVGEAQLHALMDYDPGSYQGAVTLVRARVEGPRFDDTFGWQHLAEGGVSVHDVSGGHITMMRPPYVSEVAEILRRMLMDSAVFSNR